jgi:hypothetical protein
MVVVPKTLAAFAFAGLLTRPAVATEAPLQLTWRAPAPCPNETTFRAEIATLSRRPSSREARPALTVSVIVTQTAGGAWQARITTLGDEGSGERLVSDARCEDVARAVALVLALALNPTEAVESAPPLVAPSDTDEPRFLRQMSLGFDLVTSSGTLPELDLGAQGRLAFELLPISLELRIAGFLPESEPVSISARAELVAVELGVAGCYGGDVALRFGLQGCAGVDIDWLHATSSGVSEPGGASGTWPSPFLEAVARWALSDRSGLRLAAETGRALDAPRFAVAGDGVFFKPAPALFRLGIGAELHF